MVVERYSSNRKEAISSISAQIRHMQESYERVRTCAKVKGRVELKIDKTQSKDLYLRIPQITPFQVQPQLFRC